jgi:hypothetical protein
MPLLAVKLVPFLMRSASFLHSRFGIMLWTMHTKEKPFKDVADGAIAASTFEGNRPGLDELPKELGRLIGDCWAKNPPDRPGFSKILLRLRELHLCSDMG